MNLLRTTWSNCLWNFLGVLFIFIHCLILRLLFIKAVLDYFSSIGYFPAVTIHTGGLHEDQVQLQEGMCKNHLTPNHYFSQCAMLLRIRPLPLNSRPWWFLIWLPSSLLVLEPLKLQTACSLILLGKQHYKVWLVWQTWQLHTGISTVCVCVGIRQKIQRGISK